MRYFFDDAEFDGQFLRALDTIYYGGADIGECFAAANAIPQGDKDAWHREWYSLGERIYGIGVASRAAGHVVSAREAFLRAATYFRNSLVFMFRPPLDPRMVDAFERQRDAFRQSVALNDPPAEVVEIPYEDTTLPGYFFKPDGSAAPRPTVLYTDGYDGTAEELYVSGGVAALQRGYNCLVFDGPGQGGVLIEQHRYFRPDWENVVRPVVDWALARADVDRERLVLMGRSFGGYLAPRAATAEHRVAALVADAVQYAPARDRVGMLPPQYADQIDSGDPAVLNSVLEVAMQRSPYLTFALERGMLVHNVPTPIDYVRAMAPYTLDGLAGTIDCPTMITAGANDIRGGGGKLLYDALTVPKQFITFTDAEGSGAHDEAGAAALFSQRVFDWLDEVLQRSQANRSAK